LGFIHCEGGLEVHPSLLTASSSASFGIKKY